MKLIHDNFITETIQLYAITKTRIVLEKQGAYLEPQYLWW